MFNLLRSTFTSSPAPTLQELAAGTCALPAPKVAGQVPKAPKQTDAYLEDEAANRWAFNSVTATFQSEGSVAELTSFDVELLIERGYWGGKKVQVQNQKAKRMWHSGETSKAAAAALGLSESWVDKRFGTFAAALSDEKSKSVANQ
jgi:hypothetical protein